MAFDAVGYLNDGLAQADWTVTDLWLGTYALGGNLSPTEVADLADGSARLTPADYNLLVIALNDRLFDRHCDR